MAMTSPERVMILAMTGPPAEPHGKDRNTLDALLLTTLGDRLLNCILRAAEFERECCPCRSRRPRGSEAAVRVGADLTPMRFCSAKSSPGMRQTPLIRKSGGQRRYGGVAGPFVGIGRHRRQTRSRCRDTGTRIKWAAGRGPGRHSVPLSRRRPLTGAPHVMTGQSSSGHAPPAECRRTRWARRSRPGSRVARSSTLQAAKRRHRGGPLGDQRACLKVGRAAHVRSVPSPPGGMSHLRRQHRSPTDQSVRYQSSPSLRSALRT